MLSTVPQLQKEPIKVTFMLQALVCRVCRWSLGIQGGCCVDSCNQKSKANNALDPKPSGPQIMGVV